MRSPISLLFLLLPLVLGFSPKLSAEAVSKNSSAKWEKEIAAFEAKDRENSPAKGGIVFVGSSSIRKWVSLAEDFPHHHVLNRGFGGSQMIDSVYFADRIVFPYEPRMIVVYAGANDISAGKTPSQVSADFRAFVEKVHAKSPSTPIAFISIAGNLKRWSQVDRVKEANALIADYVAKNPNLKFIDVFPHMLDADGRPLPDIFVADKLHMNEKGYRIWTKIVEPFLPAPDQ